MSSNNRTFEAMSSDLNADIQVYRDLDKKIKDMEHQLLTLKNERESLADRIVEARDEFWKEHPEVSPHWAGPPRSATGQSLSLDDDEDEDLF